MKITRIKVKNFKGVEDRELDLNELTAFVGPNGVGKSSMLKALIYGISGNLPEDAIRHGASEASVTMELDTGDIYTRRYIRSIDKDGKTIYTTKIRLNGKACTGKALDEYLSGIPGADKKTSKVVTSTEVLSALKAEEFGEFILGYLTEEFDFNKVLSYCGKISPEAVAKLKSYTQNAEEYLPHAGTFYMDAVDKVYYELASARNKEAERPMLKSAVARLKARAVFDGAAPTRAEAEVDAELQEIAKLEGSVQISRIALENYNKAMQSIENQKKEISDLKQQIMILSADRPNKAKYQQMNDRLRSVEESIVRNEKMAGSLRSAIISAKDMLGRLSSDKCLCFDGLTCTTDKTCRKAELTESIEDSQEALDCARLEIDKLKSEKVSIRQEMDRYRANESTYERRLMLEKRLDNLMRMPIRFPEKPAEIQIRDFSQEKVMLQQERNRIVRYRQYINEKNELERKEKELEVVEELVEIFGPKGVFKENVINYYLNMLEAIMNDEASRLKAGFSIQLVYDEGVRVLCEPRAGQGFIPYHSVSSGEQVLVLYLIMYLLNELTGLHILIMDDLNHLDRDAFKALAELLNSSDTLLHFEHVLVSSVDNKEVVDTLAGTGFDIVTF